MSATKAERAHMGRVKEMACIVTRAKMVSVEGEVLFVPVKHSGPVHAHHALTGGGGRRNHMKVLPLCWNHHQGPQGIHTMGRKAWWEKFGHEADLLEKVNELLGIL